MRIKWSRNLPLQLVQQTRAALCRDLVLSLAIRLPDLFAAGRVLRQAISNSSSAYQSPICGNEYCKRVEQSFLLSFLDR